MRASYADLKADPALLSIAQTLLDATPSSVDSQTRMRTLFVRGLASLVSQGLIFLQDEEADVYEAVSFEGNLGPHILGLISDPRNHDVTPLDGSASGVSSSSLLSLIGASHFFCNVPRKVILDALALLLADSYIYECSNRVYAPVPP